MPAVERYGPVGIYRRTASNYRVVWWDSGRRRERSFTTIEAARDRALELAGDLRIGRAASGDASFGQLVAQAVDPGRHPSWGPRHTASVESIARTHIIPTVGGIKCADLTSRDLVAVIQAKAAEGYARATLAQIIKVMRMAVKDGIRLGIWRAGADPGVDLALPRAAVDDVAHDLHYVGDDLPTTADVARFARALDRYLPGGRLLVRLAAGSGLRLGELLALRPSDFDWTEGTLRVSRSVVDVGTGTPSLGVPKTASSRRVVYLTPSLARQMRAYCTERALGRNDLLWGNRTGGLYRRSNVERQIRRAKDDVSYSWTFHSLRHYRATHLLRQGAQLDDVRHQLGHSRSTTTLTLYVRTDVNVGDRIRELG